jgi:hypothetical protein
MNQIAARKITAERLNHRCWGGRAKGGIQDLRITKDLQDAGWTVIRVREEPLDRLQPGDVPVRKGRYKETCNRVLLKITVTQSLQANALGE